MRLTDREKEFIARYAGGAHVLTPTLRQIIEDYEGDGGADDQVFLDFGRLALQPAFKYSDYEVLQLAVLKRVPKPFGPPWDKQPPERQIPRPPQSGGPVDSVDTTKERKRRAVTCSICGETGHNARGCSNKPSTSTIKHMDGIERLAPGFDPNPPGADHDDV